MGRPRKYFTEEEKKAAQRENERRYRETHKDKIAAKSAKYYQRNKDKINEYYAEYRKNNKDKYAEYMTEYRKNNKDNITKQRAEYRQVNKEKIAEYMAKYRLTPFGRASYLVGSYRRNDRKCNRGECTLTAEWIVDNIFSQPCHYCGETDWTKIGCDRKDSSLPHTPENCVPCCKHCNDMKGNMGYDDYISKIKSGGSPTS